MNNLSSNEQNVSLLDIFEVLARAWKFLIIVPVVTTLAVLVVLLLLPREYESRALVKLGGNAVMLQAPNVLIPVIDRLQLRKDRNLDRVLRELSDRIQFSPYLGSDITDVRLSDSSPDEAQKTLQEVIAEALRQLAPRGGAREDMETNLASLNSAIKELETYGAKLRADTPKFTSIADGDAYSRSLATIANEIQTKKAQGTAIERQLRGPGAESVVATPHLPDSPVPQRKAAILVLIFLLALFIAVILVFFKNAVDMAKRDPENQKKIESIRNSFRLFR